MNLPDDTRPTRSSYDLAVPATKSLHELGEAADRQTRVMLGAIVSGVICLVLFIVLLATGHTNPFTFIVGGAIGPESLRVWLSKRRHDRYMAMITSPSDTTGK